MSQRENTRRDFIKIASTAVVNVPEHHAENVKACQEPEESASAEDDQAIRQCQENFYANLAPQYQWLRNWEAV